MISNFIIFKKYNVISLGNRFINILLFIKFV